MTRGARPHTLLTTATAGPQQRKKQHNSVQRHLTTPESSPTLQQREQSRTVLTWQTTMEPRKNDQKHFADCPTALLTWSTSSLCQSVSAGAHWHHDLPCHTRQDAACLLPSSASCSHLPVAMALDGLRSSQPPTSSSMGLKVSMLAGLSRVLVPAPAARRSGSTPGDQHMITTCILPLCQFQLCERFQSAEPCAAKNLHTSTTTALADTGKPTYWQATHFQMLTIE